MDLSSVSDNILRKEPPRVISGGFLDFYSYRISLKVLCVISNEEAQELKEICERNPKVKKAG